MFVLIGIVVTMVMVFGGFISHGGNMGVIFGALPTEAMVIGGAAVGSFITGNSGSIMKKAGKGMGKSLKGSKWKSEDYNDLLCLLFMLSQLIKTKGVIALEAHIENPEESKILQLLSIDLIFKNASRPFILGIIISIITRSISEYCFLNN